jgi:hypothetical protein
MRKEFALMGIVVLLMVFASSALVSAQTYTAGVQTGDTFEYAVSISGSLASYSPAYNVVSATATITDVTGSLVTYSLEVQYQNGTQRTLTASTNVTSGESVNSTNLAIPWGLVAANLAVNEPTYINSTTWANETVTINGRTTDHTYETYSEAEGTENGTLDLYWDQATGVPYNVTETVTESGTTLLDFNYYLTGTSVWVVPEFSPEVMAIIMTAAFGVAVATALRRKEKPLHQTKLL